MYGIISSDGKVRAWFDTYDDAKYYLGFWDWLTSVTNDHHVIFKDLKIGEITHIRTV